ncbi:MAG: hypothetical protein FWC41_13765 [Firmicutes bacterium]|nr:hypothetical protein [Bacillota bacterium]
MNNDKICYRAAKCPMFSGVLESNPTLIRTYKNLYCENGKDGHEKCKRFQVAALVGSCPSHILPNSQLSVDEIIKRM